MGIIAKLQLRHTIYLANPTFIDFYFYFSLTLVQQTVSYLTVQLKIVITAQKLACSDLEPIDNICQGRHGKLTPTLHTHCCHRLQQAGRTTAQELGP